MSSDKQHCDQGYFGNMGVYWNIELGYQDPILIAANFSKLKIVVTG